MNYSAKIEEPSKVLRKITITIPATEIEKRFNLELGEVQKRAKVKGFREGHVPPQMVKSMYGPQVRHQLYHDLVDESLRRAAQDNKLRPVGRPRLESSDHDHSKHSLPEGQDFTFTAHWEIMPEVPIPSYEKISLKREKVEVKDEDTDPIIQNLLNNYAELIPSEKDKVEKGDFVDMTFDGGVVAESGVEKRQDMSGTRVVEVGSGSLVPGFEDELVGLKQDEEKTFRIRMPKEYGEESLADKEAEFKVKINSFKKKKLPELNDDFAKMAGYDSLAVLREKAFAAVKNSKARNSEEKLKSELLQQLIDKAKFDIPTSLVQAQAQSLAREWVQELKQNGASDATIEDLLKKEQQNVMKKAENQVRAGLILDAISKKESIEVGEDKIKQRISEIAVQAGVDEQKVREFYHAEPERLEDLEFRMREELTLAFILGKVKVAES